MNMKSYIGICGWKEEGNVDEALHEHKLNEHK